MPTPSSPPARIFPRFSGSYAASSFGQYLVDNNLLNASLVPIKKFDTSTGASSGFAFIDQGAYRTTTSAASGPGVVQRVDLVSGGNILPTRMVESPLTGTKEFVSCAPWRRLRTVPHLCAHRLRRHRAALELRCFRSAAGDHANW